MTARSCVTRVIGVCAVGVALVVATGCQRSAPPAAYRPTATIKDIMDAIVDPSADAIWDSVATTVSAAGIDEKRPRTDEEWQNVRHRAVQLAEAPNLLVLDGRHVALPGEKAENEEVELSPPQIEALIGADRQAWVRLAQGLQDAAMVALSATEKKDADALLEAGEGIDKACESCHLKYWYPLSKQAEKAREGAASPRK